MHWKVARRTLATKRNAAERLVVCASGPDLIVVFGAAVAASVAEGRIAPVTSTAASGQRTSTVLRIALRAKSACERAA